MTAQRDDGPGLVEVLAVWALWLATAAAIFVTYARFPAEEFYHVSRSGLGGGASRALVFLNFPLAFAAIALLAVVLARWQSSPVAASPIR